LVEAEEQLSNWLSIKSALFLGVSHFLLTGPPLLDRLATGVDATTPSRDGEHACVPLGKLRQHGPCSGGVPRRKVQDVVRDSWRELQSIADYGRSAPSIDPVFGVFYASESDAYWSSTSFANGPDVAWVVDFFGGFVIIDGQDVNSYALAVRTGP
jgi:hypothetical protein